MDWFMLNSPITVGIYVFLIVMLAMNAPRIFAWLHAQQDAVERYGRPIRKFKYAKLVPWVGRIPIPADVMTLSRLFLVGASLRVVNIWGEDSPLTALIMPMYIIGWSTDYLDGLKSEAEAKRRRRRSPHGKWLDPSVDMLCFADMAMHLGPLYPPAVLLGFGSAIGARCLLFVLVLTVRLCSQYWRTKLRSSILPKTITGEVKAAFIALSFGLMLHHPSDPENFTWASRLLVVAIGFEAVTLIYFIRCAVRGDYARPELSLVQSPQKTGS